jgi:hypothetical protein
VITNSREDQDYVGRLVEQLSEAGLVPWTEAQIPVPRTGASPAKSGARLGLRLNGPMDLQRLDQTAWLETLVALDGAEFPTNDLSAFDGDLIIPDARVPCSVEEVSPHHCTSGNKDV